jgi:hypothetical protein
MNIFNRIKYLRIYAKILDQNRQTLQDKYNFKIDNIYRIYSFISIEEAEYRKYGGDNPISKENEMYFPKAFKSGDIVSGDEYLKGVVSSKINQLDHYLISIGLSEMYGLASKQRVGKLTYKVILRYKYLDTLLLANLSLLSIITIISSGIIGSILLLFL